MTSDDADSMRRKIVVHLMLIMMLFWNTAINWLVWLAEMLLQKLVEEAQQISIKNEN